MAQAKLLKSKPECLFSALPASLRETKTDADGRFSLVLDRSHSYVIAANGSRVIGDKLEEYYWFVNLKPESSERILLLLSNDNLLGEDLP